MTRLTLRIDFDQDHQLGPGKVRLLELVDEHGSITAACRAMDMSYNCGAVAWIDRADASTPVSLPLGSADGKGASQLRHAVQDMDSA